MNKLFWQCFGTGMKWISIVVLTIFTLVLLGNWWTDLSFPYFLFDWDADDRKCIFWTSVALTALCALFSWSQTDALDGQQIIWRNGMSYSRVTNTRKSPDVVDIALGVATGAVIGEVINDFLED